MQMIHIGRCSFYMPSASFRSHESKSACQPERLAHGLFEDVPSAKINIILETCKRLTVFYFLYSLSITNIVWNVVKVSAPKGESFLFSPLRAMYEVFGYDGVGWTLEYLWQKIRYDRIVTPTGLMIERTYLYRLKQSR